MFANFTEETCTGTGAALHVTGTNNHLEYRGVEFTSA